MNSFYREYLDAAVERRGTHCIKWDHLQQIYGRSDLESAWVADMDFRTVPAVRDALVERAEHAIYGYTDDEEANRLAEVKWLQRRHQLKVEPDWILYSPGVVDSIFFCVRALTEEGDAVLIQTPVYGPFYEAIHIFNRRLVENPLVETEEGWRIDFDDLDQKLADPAVKLMVLCNPHNPVGRIWTMEELTRMVNLANRHGVVIVSDEIHADFALDGRRVPRILTVPGAERSVMLASATKSFNLAGLRQSSCIVPDLELRKRIRLEIQRAHAVYPNLFGAIAQMTAYTYGDEWMDAVVEYIQENRDWFVAELRRRIPKLKARPQEGTYLLWVDFKDLGMEHEEIAKMLVEKARVALVSGLEYGKGGRGFFRVNLATPRVHLEELLNRLERAINE
ncbi:MAG: pyridoxal phosphate-dependent aminotransferase [Clostridia bacterium]|nr:pyridoxal phosphate-dependent aminotransferase [Clostridia bacterium]MBQ8973254.1 pyridoxal phosphate-dependent aminotransferase [Clostridia bacterium]